MEVLWALVSLIKWLWSVRGEDWLLTWCYLTLGYCLYVLVVKPVYGWLHKITFF